MGLRVGFPRFYRAVKEMFTDVVRETAIAREIVRKSGFKPGRAGSGDEPNLFGVPRGGKKGYALVKRSDEDFDCEWQPHGPYVYDWNEYLPEQWNTWIPIEVTETAGRQIAIRKDTSPDIAIEPVPQVIESWVHINEDLRQGVDNDDAKGFVFERWRTATRSVPRTPPATGSALWSFYEPDPTFVTDEVFFNTISGTDPAWQYDGTDLPVDFGWGYRCIGMNAAPSRVRVQAYITECSERAFFSLGLDSTGVHGPISRYYYDEVTARNVLYLSIEGPGYYDSGWIPVRHNYAETSNGFSHASARLELRFYDYDTVTPAIPFTELQLVGYEFSDSFDWLYARGELPNR